MKFADNFQEILIAFIEEGVDFLVVGGYAVNFYGYDRNTGDLDIWINPNEPNIDKIKKALISLEYLNKEDKHLEALNLSAPSCFRLGDGALTVDIFTHMAGVQYPDAAKDKIPFQIASEMTVYFISLNNLVINKTQTGRPKDIADVDELQRIQKHRKRND